MRFARVLTELAGLTFTPKKVRRRLYAWAGAQLRSAPGRHFTFNGDPSHLTVGHGTYFNRSVFVEAVAPVTIGDHCHVGMEALFLTSHHPIGPDGQWTFAAEGKPVVLGNHVWVGARAILLPGAVIGSNVIIAAGAVVTGRCEPGGVYAGVPAKRIREVAVPE